MKPNRTKHILVASLLFAAAATRVADAFAEVVVVVSAKNGISSLSTNQVAKIFLAKTGSFPDGNAAVPLDQAEGSAIRRAFYLEVTGKGPVQVKAYWSKIIFSGDGQPPRALVNDEAVKKAVASDKNAIGYIDRRFVDSSVKIVLTPSVSTEP